MEILVPNLRSATPDGSPGSSGRVVAVFFMTAAMCLAGSPQQPVEEYHVKAAFVYNFVKFVEWPSGAFPNTKEPAPIYICVLGIDPFGRSLEDTVAGQAVDSHVLTVRHSASPLQLAGCHVVFISAAESKRSPGIVAEVKAPGVLTIGDSDSSGTEGDVITFRLDGGKVRFDISLSAAQRQKLRISSRLLSLAHLIE